MTHDVTALPPEVRDRLTTLLVQAGHLNHPLRLHAHVESDASADALRRALTGVLPAHMVPAQITVTQALPRLPNGKLDRAGLMQGRGDQAAVVASAVTATPDTQVLETLRGIWAEVLGSDEIYDEDNFVEMGGDSLLSISVVARARAAGLDIVPSDLFDFATLAELAERVAADAAAPSADAVEQEADTPTEPALASVAQGPLSISTKGDSTGAPPVFLLNANRKILDLLNEQLNPRRNLHLLTLHWDSGQITADDSIETVATDYLARIKAIQPEGPYAIGGFSMGAVAANQIAVQMAAAGDKVSSLILLDPPENPALFGRPHNTEHVFLRDSSEQMPLLRRVRHAVVLRYAAVLRSLGRPLPTRLRRYVAAATYFRAAKRHAIPAPATPPIIVRRSYPAPTSMWARAGEMRALHEQSCDHADFHRDPEVIRAWTGQLAQTLDEDAAAGLPRG